MGRSLTDKQLYKLKNELLAEAYTVVSPLEFYRDLFPCGAFESRGVFSDSKPNGILTRTYLRSEEDMQQLLITYEKQLKVYENSRVSGDEYVKRPKRPRKNWGQSKIIFDDLQEIKDAIKDKNENLDFIVIPPISFSGKNRTKKNAYHLWGICIDLDGVGETQCIDLIHQIDYEHIPQPTYIVNSGHGLHIYYMFEDAIPLYPWMYKQITELKKVLTDVVWNTYTSSLPLQERQYQSIVQAYRMVGTQSKLGKRYKVKAFKVGAKRTLKYLTEWCEESEKINFDEFRHITIDEAKRLWPEWYQWRVVEGKKRKTFDFAHPEVYKAWIKRLRAGAFDGNRYNCICVLFSLAYKTKDISFEKALEDAMNLVEYLNSLTKNKYNSFTNADVLDASAYYSEEFRSIGLKAVYRMTGINIPPTKRNYRKRKIHLQEKVFDENGKLSINSCRANRELKLKQMRENKEIYGRPRGSGTKEKVIEEYIKKNPNATVSQIAKECNVSRTTVYKWKDIETWKKKELEKLNSIEIIQQLDKEMNNEVKYENSEQEEISKLLAKNLLMMSEEDRKKVLLEMVKEEI